MEFQKMNVINSSTGWNIHALLDRTDTRTWTIFKELNAKVHLLNSILLCLTKSLHWVHSDRCDFLRRNHFVFVSLRLFVYIHFFIMKKDRKKHVIPKHKNQPYVFILVGMCVCECVCNSNAENECLYEGMPRILLKWRKRLSDYSSCVSNWFFSYIFLQPYDSNIFLSVRVFSYRLHLCA